MSHGLEDARRSKVGTDGHEMFSRFTILEMDNVQARFSKYLNCIHFAVENAVGMVNDGDANVRQMMKPALLSIEHDRLDLRLPVQRD